MQSKNLGRCFDASLAPDKVAIIDLRPWDQPQETTYADFDAECDAVARGLVRKGFKRGDRIGILSLNRRELLAAYFGAMRAGMVVVPISFKLAADIISHIVGDAELVAIFHDEERAALCPSNTLNISFDDPGGYAALLDFGPFETVEPKPRELAMILYTSGSTGKPKGVLLSHDSQRWALERGEKLYGENSSHRYIVAAPMFHMNATISVKSALSSGGSLVLLPFFRAIDYARAMAFLAIDEASGDMLGVGRLHIMAHSDTAEYAVLVRSDMKGRGLGWQLMQMLIDYARHEGITTIRGEVLAENTTMLRMCGELGFDIVENPDDPQIRIVTLPVKPA